MDIIQPLDLEAGFRTFSFDNKHHLVITQKLYFPLQGGDPLLFCDAYQEMAKLDTPFLDEGLPKLKPEFFTMGNAMSPKGKPVSALQVSCEFAGIKKDLHIVGDRYWMGGVTGTSTAVPFTQMPLIWKNAFGGKDYPLNTQGKGINKEKTDIGEDLILMPNIEYAKHLMTNKGQTPPAAGYMPLLIDHPLRSKYLGTYDDDWLANCYPGYPKDFNFNAFSCALSDQQLPSPLQGGENFELKNLHDVHSTLQGSIPKLNTRAFVVKPGIKITDLQESDLKEIKTQIDTVVFFPNQLMGMLIFRGSIEVNESDASDYKHLLCAYEASQSPAKEKSHYFQSLVGRLHPDLNMQYALTTKDLIPENVPCGMARLTQQDLAPFLLADHIKNKLSDALSDKLNDTQQQLVELIAQQKKMGLDTKSIEQQLSNLENPVKDEWQVKFDVVIEKLAPGTLAGGEINLQKIDFKAFDELAILSEEYAIFQKDKAQSHLQQQIENALLADNISLASSLDQTLNRFNLPAELPRATNPEIKLNEIKAAFSQNNTNVDFLDVENKLNIAYSSQVESYKMGAHMMDMGTPPLASQAIELKNKALISVINGKSLKHQDLSGIDFSGEDLSGVDFSFCYLEQCNFNNANLEGANLNGAIAARCNFSYANLKSANLNNSNIGACNFNYCDLSNAKSSGCEYAKSDFSHATLTNLDLSNSLNTQDVCFYKANLSGVNFGEATFIETSFHGANLNECQMASSTFQECDLSYCHGKQVQLQGSNVINSKFNNCKFSKSDLTNCRFLDNSSLNESQFVDCILADSTLRGITLEYCEFINSTLNGCDISESNAKHSIFNGCHALNSLFIKTDFTHSNLSNSNFMYSNLLQANLTQANLSQSNFYGCEFMGVSVAKTNFGRSNLHATKLADWRPSKWQ